MRFSRESAGSCIYVNACYRLQTIPVGEFPSGTVIIIRRLGPSNHFRELEHSGSIQTFLLSLLVIPGHKAAPQMICLTAFVKRFLSACITKQLLRTEECLDTSAERAATAPNV